MGSSLKRRVSSKDLEVSVGGEPRRIRFDRQDRNEAIGRLSRA